MNRFTTRIIQIGNLCIGGNEAVRLQSMTSTDTLNTRATVAQCIDLASAGCEIIRISAPSVRAAKNLAQIKTVLREKGIDVPLVADIHFNHRAAEVAARIVEKIRINPGNFVEQGSEKFLSDDATDREIQAIEEKLAPLLAICKTHHTAVRIGVNHGSLSGRILYRHGNTAEGMMVSAMEYIELCRKHDFHQLVLSLKSSSIPLMIQANRLLVESMKTRGWDYPLHLGVTEAGNADEGRIRSAAGIGTLIREGIGDTIRVSLTEDPVKEIPVAREILEYASRSRKTKFFHYSMEKPDRTSLPLVLSTYPDTAADMHVRGSKAFDKRNFPYILERKEKDKTADKESRLHLIKAKYRDLSPENFMIHSAIDLAAPLMREDFEAVWIDAGNEIPASQATENIFHLLQAIRMRITRTEFISCPSCARTLFDIEALVQQVKNKTSHLKGLKIAVMGCIVNGPGEMAGADYGLLGSGKDQLSLYRGQTLVKKKIPLNHAAEELVRLIRESGDWPESTD
ncbi:MAG: (E)-4-hydroxy-3-methylbut-2-enyl-diphosphate synthase [Bacteroidota bacterium]|nr:(E)-4-hydroxy-3-methylbut-2-enyl-diphosphate synthase [Bacteroidota bacterium]